MASAIIYLAIIGMWVAYFLPRWIHTHDEFSGKSVERYKSALRVVAGEAEAIQWQYTLISMPLTKNLKLFSFKLLNIAEEDTT